MSEPDFAFEKKLGINESVIINNDNLMHFIGLLLQCMRGTNNKHGVYCDSFRLDYRPQYMNEELMGEFARGSMVLDMKWGSKEELEKKKGKNDNI